MTGEKLQKLIGGKYFLPVLSFLIAPVSYTHLDVYKRQIYTFVNDFLIKNTVIFLNYMLK